MPILNVKVSATKSPELVKEITGMLLDITSRILGKKREVTAIAIDFIDHDCWLAGEKLLSEQNKNSFYFDVKIVDETTTKEQKALYLKEAFSGFEKILGNLHNESYIYIQDVRGAAYGFGGLSQECRAYR